MSDDIFKILVDFDKEVRETLADDAINSYTEWKYRRYLMLTTYLLDIFSW